MKISKQTEYALMALVHLADHENQRVTAKVMAETYQISVQTMGKVMQALNRAGLLQSMSHRAPDGFCC